MKKYSEWSSENYTQFLWTRRALLPLLYLQIHAWREELIPDPSKQSQNIENRKELQLLNRSFPSYYFSNSENGDFYVSLISCGCLSFPNPNTQLMITETKKSHILKYVSLLITFVPYRDSRSTGTETGLISYPIFRHSFFTSFRLLGLYCTLILHFVKTWDVRGINCPIRLSHRATRKKGVIELCRNVDCSYF